MKAKIVLITVLGGFAAVAVAGFHTVKDMGAVDFAQECVTVSDPADINVYLHEEVVNSFLGVQGKFGRGRIPMIQWQHQKLATHGGTTRLPEEWRDEDTAYMLDDWGMIGDLDQKTARVYFLKGTFEGNRKADMRKGGTQNAEDLLDDREADAFERYAIAQLRKGEKLVRWSRPEFVRYVGTITAAVSCIACHADAKEGDMLGAFTYDYVKQKAGPRKKDDVAALALAGTPWSALMEHDARAWSDGEKYTSGGSRAYRAQERHVSIALATSGIVLPRMIEIQKGRRTELEKESAQLEQLRKEREKTGELPVRKKS